MRIELQFVLAKREIDIEYRRILLHFIKKSLSEVNGGTYYKKYYRGHDSKDFTFAVKLPNPVFEVNRIKLDNNTIKVIWSTSDYKLGLIFINAFMAQLNKVFPLANQNEMTLVKVFKWKDNEVRTDKIRIKMISPLIIREHCRDENKDHYYSVKQDNFQEKAVEIIKSQLRLAGYTENYIDDFNITPLDTRTVIVKHYECNVESSLGNFELQGKPVVLNYLLGAGLGSRKNQGFGAAVVVG